MADQKRWFKVWGSIVGDPHFGELPLEDVARWALLGAYVAVHGTRGRLTVPGDARTLCQVLRVTSREAAVEALARLPNVHVDGAETQRVNRYGTSYPQCANEEGKRVDGELVVTLSNWRVYQEDSTAAQRMKTLRSKRRREVEAETTTTSPPTPRTEKRPARPARSTRGPVRSSLSGDSDNRGEGQPLDEVQAPAASFNGSSHGGPLAGTVAAVLQGIRPRPAVGFVPRAEPAP